MVTSKDLKSLSFGKLCSKAVISLFDAMRIAITEMVTKAFEE